jgi:hypothetical protein
MKGDVTGRLPAGSAGMSGAAASGEWHRFWRIVIFGTVLPILILLGALEALGWSIGETYTPGALAHELDVHPDLVWMGVRIQAHSSLKLAQLAEIRPDVLIMGQSRLGQARAEMFHPYTFYNLARVSWPYQTYADILRHFPDGYRPKLILFDADFYMFGPKFAEHYADMSPVYGHQISENLIQVHNVATQLLQHPQIAWKRFDYTGHPARGISAILDGDAFRKDGSERIPAAFLALAGRSPQDVLRPEWRDYITGGNKMGEAEMTALKEFVDLAHEKGIPLAGVEMPMYGPAVRLMEADPGYAILADFRKRVTNGYFDQLGVPFFDYLNFPPYTEDYRYFSNAVHPGEQLTAAVIASLASDPRFHALLPRLSPTEILAELNAPGNVKQHILLIQ